MWEETFQVIEKRKDDIVAFCTRNRLDKTSRIILTGAGTSAFVADSAVCVFMKDGFSGARSVATTDIVSAPEFFISPEDRFFISFARSGNSPESVAAYKMVRKLCHEAIHLIITCNPNGRLALEADPEKDLVLVLPDGTNDRSLAMTSSYSSMLIASLLFKNICNLEQERARLETAVSFASAFLTDEIEGKLAGFTQRKITRAVFLGSGSMTGNSTMLVLALLTAACAGAAAPTRRASKEGCGASAMFC